MKPLVSVMMPVYNGMPFIKYSLKSLQNQIYNNWECIIVDDGSIDDTFEFLKSITDTRIKVYRFSQNKGRAHARQKALEEAKGKYLAMLDADDLYHPEKIERQVNLMESNPEISLVCTSMISFGYNTNSMTKRGSAKDEIRTYAPNEEPLHAPSMLRAEYAKQIQYSSYLNFGEDRDFLSKYLSRYPVYMILSKAYYYYSEYDSVSKTKILKSYFNRMKYYLKQHRIKEFAITSSKYIYSLLSMPFMSNDSIIKKRGWNISDSEKNDFEAVFKTVKE